MKIPIAKKKKETRMVQEILEVWVDERKEKKKKSYRTVAAALAINFSKIRNWFCADSSESFRKQEGSEKDIHKCTLEQKKKKIISVEVAQHICWGFSPWKV
jgi:hypothetical protein